jgi:prefoldin subunit 5
MAITEDEIADRLDEARTRLHRVLEDLPDTAAETSDALQAMSAAATDLHQIADRLDFSA